MPEDDSLLKTVTALAGLIVILQVLRLLKVLEGL